MFQYSRRQSGFSAFFAILHLIFVNTVRHIRKSHRSPIMALVVNIVQSLLLVAVFSFMYTVFGMRRTLIQGDFILFLMSGIFLFMTYNKTLITVASADPPTSPMMQHAPMNTSIALASSALSSLYTQTLSVVVILSVYELGWGRVEFQNLTGAAAMFFLAWACAAALGTVFFAAKPWAPQFVGIIQQVYTRANMFTSGKMFVANSMPTYMLAMFTWNPLFHVIDQARGFTFVNYNPHNSSTTYPVAFSLVCLTIGLLAEFFTRKHASASWSAR